MNCLCRLLILQLEKGGGSSISPFSARLEQVFFFATISWKSGPVEKKERSPERERRVKVEREELPA